jgi:hypothetical protein
VSVIFVRAAPKSFVGWELVRMMGLEKSHGSPNRISWGGA